MASNPIDDEFRWIARVLPRSIAWPPLIRLQRRLDGALESAPELDGFGTSLVDEFELEVEMGPNQNLNDLFGELDRRGITVVSLRNKANRLEELFMRLVENKQNGSEAAAS